MLENEIKELTAAVRENTETMKQMIAGREEALAALTAKDGAGTTTTATTTTRRGRKPKDEPTDAGTDAGSDDGTTTAAATAPSWNPDLSVDGLKAIAQPYLAVEDLEQRKVNSAKVREVLTHLGADVLNPVPTKPDAKPLEGDDVRRQAAFFITRLREGLTIDFSTDYDFNSDPLTQGNLEPAPAAEEDDDILG